MAKKYKSTKERKEKGDSLGIYMVVIVPITLFCILVMYFILQGVAERLGLSPLIFLGITTDSWMSSGEAVLMFVLWLSVSIVLGMLISYLLIKAAVR